MLNYAKAIGGYGEIGLPIKNSGVPDNAMLFQSARSALYAFLKCSTAKTIYLPEYICESLYPALESLNISIKHYQLNQKLLPVEVPDVTKNEYVLLVNYFGLCGVTIKEYITQPDISIRHFIVDNSQAFFTPPVDCAANIYSLRKFLALPDGGLLFTEAKVIEPTEGFNGEDYLSHLLLRNADNTQKGYEHFLHAEAALDDYRPKKMSSVSRRLYQSFDIENIKKKRKENFEFLFDYYQHINKFNFYLNGNESPLCYPLTLSYDVTNLCSALIKKDIFLPRYWPNLMNSAHDFVSSIYNNTLFIPIDERIDESKMKLLITEIDKVLLEHKNE
ncbi:hypothetical protein AADZ91_01855 [Colwelliaceae bacterium 6441]